jgi:Flp pilus assembly protein TadG
MSTRVHPRRRDHEGGQILALFVLGVTILIAASGLVLDGGETFAHRRTMQNTADLAAIAGANAYINTSGSVATKTAAAIAAAEANASKNGYTDGAASTTVNVTATMLSAGIQVNVDIGRPHINKFVRVIGMTTWDVSVTASAISGVTDSAEGAAPWLMSLDAFNPDGSPKYTSANPQWFGEGNGDYPTSPLDISWTDFQGWNNVNTAEVEEIIDGTNVVTATVFFEQYIGQHNQGNHTALFDEVDDHLAGRDVPVAVVGPGSPDCASPTETYQNGCFKGWVMFHVIEAEGGSTKAVRGYFTDNFIGSPLAIGDCTPDLEAAGTCGIITANSPFVNYVVRLTN